MGGAAWALMVAWWLELTKAWLVRHSPAQCKVQHCGFCRIPTDTGDEVCASCMPGYEPSVENADPVTACVPGSGGSVPELW